jgi:HlyD family secretion protein
MLPPAALRFKPKTEGDEAKPKGKESADSREPSAGRPAATGGASGGGKGGAGKGKKGGGQKVYLLKEGKPVALPVKTGIANNSSIELLESELKEGDEVIIGQSGGDAKKKAGASGSPMGPRF